MNGEWSIVNGESTNQPINLLTLLWSCKEAVFKWYGMGAVDFKKHIRIRSIDVKKNNLYCSFLKEGEISIQTHYLLFDKMCLAWVMD